MGLDADSIQEELKQRFRELARKDHPDTGGSDAHLLRLKNAHDHTACSFPRISLINPGARRPPTRSAKSRPDCSD